MEQVFKQVRIDGVEYVPCMVCTEEYVRSTQALQVCDKCKPMNCTPVIPMGQLDWKASYEELVDKYMDLAGKYSDLVDKYTGIVLDGNKTD